MSLTTAGICRLPTHEAQGAQGVAPSRLKESASWYFQVYIRVRLLRRNSSNHGSVGWLPPHWVGGEEGNFKNTARGGFSCQNMPVMMPLTHPIQQQSCPIQQQSCPYHLSFGLFCVPHPVDVLLAGLLWGGGSIYHYIVGLLVSAVSPQFGIRYLGLNQFRGSTVPNNNSFLLGTWCCLLCLTTHLLAGVGPSPPAILKLASNVNTLSCVASVAA